MPPPYSHELGVDSVYDVFSEITPEPVAAASLGQVYRATLKTTGDVVAEPVTCVVRTTALP